MSIGEKQATRIHYNMALIGGYLGTYGLLTRGGNFPSAQTSNLISIVTLMIGRDPLHLIVRIGALAVYVSAIALCTWLPKHTRVRLPEASLAVSSIAVLVSPLIPLATDPFLALYPLFFATAFQWCSSTAPGGLTCETIFSTKNRRQFSSPAVDVGLNHDDSFRDKFRFFGGTLLSFHCGAAAAVLLSLSFDVKASLFCLVPLASAWIQLEAAAHRVRAERIA